VVVGNVDAAERSAASVFSEAVECGPTATGLHRQTVRRTHRGHKSI